MKKKHGRCPHCMAVYDITASGTVKGLAVLASLAGVRLNPWVALGLGLASLIWANAIEEWLNARCPECRVALEIIGETYG